MYNQNDPFSSYPFISDINADSNAKLSEDRYEVFVDGDFVGYKTLKAQGEQLSDIDGFLRMQGLTNFSTSLDGDHYYIQTKSQSGDIADALDIYFNNR